MLELKCDRGTWGQDGTKGHSPFTQGGVIIRKKFDWDAGGGAMYCCLNHAPTWVKATQNNPEDWEFICGIKPLEEYYKWATQADGSVKLVREEDKYMGKNPYVDSWEVTGSKGEVYKVSQRKDGTFACNCPAWKFKPAPKPDCKHIKAITEAARTSQRVSQRFTCSRCDMEFWTLESLRKHEFTHTYATIECNICGRRFERPSLLKRHKEEVHTAAFFADPPVRSGYRSAVQAQAKPKPAPEPEIQEVQIAEERFSVVRKFKFLPE